MSDNDNYIPPDGAGILFVCNEDYTALFLLRSSTVRRPLTWGLPGGGIKEGETFDKCAFRECVEEVGSLPRNGKLLNILTNKKNNYTYKIYIINISLDEKLLWSDKIKLNSEHTDYKWFKFGKFPEKLHPAIDVLEN
jgi:8-oxo-dGTP pyrophosphatase MutT (NUDIX family)